MKKEKDIEEIIDIACFLPFLILFIILYPLLWIAEKLSFFIKTILQSGKKAKEGEHNT